MNIIQKTVWSVYLVMWLVIALIPFGADLFGSTMFLIGTTISVILHIMWRDKK